MRSKLLILSLFVSLFSFGQKLPITGLCLSNVVAVTGGTCLTHAFTNANSAFFDPAYAVAGNCLADFRNYGQSAGVPTLSTTSISSIATTTAISGGSISADGGSSITAKGVCWSTSSNPTISNSKTSDGTGTGSFTSYITELSCATYYVRSYATNSSGTGYGNQLSFTPVRPTSGLSDITLLSQSNGVAITFSNVCTQTVGTPKSEYQGSGTGIGGAVYNGYTGTTCSKIPDGYYLLVARSTYALLGRVQISGGILSNVTCVTVPSLTTYWYSADLTATTAHAGGYIDSDGGSTVTARGVCWGTSPSPTLTGSFTTDGSGIGTYHTYLSGLTQNTNYYLRAYATNSQGTNYGGEVSFTTQTSGTPPTVSTDNACFVDATNAFIEGTVSSDGGATVTARGFCYSTSNTTPTTADSVSGQGSGTGYFSWSPNGLFLQDTNIYIRAYATSSVGTSYGTVYTINSNILCY